MDTIKKYKSADNLCFLTTFFIGFFTHLFGIVNVFQNQDNMYNLVTGNGAGVASGRWLLTIFDHVFAETTFAFNMPYVNAIVFLFLIAVSVKYTVSLLEIKNPVSAILIGAVFVVFPSATSTLFFRFTAIPYGIAIFCAVMAVWFIRKFQYGFLPSILLIACSMGIYQAYVPITISLMVILLLRDTLVENADAKNIIMHGLKYAGTIILGVIVYFILLHICLAVFETQLSTYQNIDQMGSIGITQLPELIKQCLYHFISILFSDYGCIAQTPVLKLGILLLGCISVGLVIFLLIAQRKKWDCILLTALLCAAFPFAVNFIKIMCPTSYIHTVMVYAFALIFTVPFVLLELLEPFQFSSAFFSACKKYINKAILLGTLIISLSYSYLANLNYTQLYYTTQRTATYMSAVVLQARMTEGFDTSMKWAFIGDDFQDPLYYDTWEAAPRYFGNFTAPSLINSYSRLLWIDHYFGYNISFVEGEQLEALEKDSTVIDMPCFPNDGSIQIIDDVVVIKLENTE